MELDIIKRIESHFSQPGKIRHILRELISHPFSGLEFVRLWPSIENYFAESPDSERLLRAFSRLCQHSLNRTAFLKSLAEHEPTREITFTLLENSDYFTDILVRHPEFLPWLATDGINRTYDPDDRPYQNLSRTTAHASEFRRFIALAKTFKRRELLRIGARDLLGLASFQETVREISLLAEAELSVVFERLYADFCQRHGRPQTSFCVLALGKLGGSELNYSSDIDVMFLYLDEGNLPESRMTHHEFFNRLAEKYIEVLTKVEEGDALYRVDARLRPDGDSGPMARSLSSALRYYEVRGQAWESQMLIKARCVAGDQELASLFLERMRPFIFPKSWLTDPLQDVRRMKTEIENKLYAREGGIQNVKLMIGGIRDVEFLVQALQRVYGGKNETLRSGNTLTALHSLHLAGILSESEATSLRNGYIFFRRIEHFQQMATGRQTHSLPEDHRQQIRLARYMQAANWNSLMREFQRNQRAIRSIFAHFLKIESGASTSISWLSFQTAEPSPEVLNHLKNLRFPSPLSIYRIIHRLVISLPATEWDAHEATWDPLLNDMLAEISRLPSPEEATNHLFDLLHRYGNLPALLNLLADQPIFRRFLTELPIRAGLLIRYFRANPNIFTYLFGLPEPKELAFKKIPWQSLADEMENTEAPEALLLRRKYEAWIVLALYFLKEITEPPQIWRLLSELADWILQALVEVVRRKLHLPEKGWALFALGKYGSQEINFGSDLDLICLLEQDDDGLSNGLVQLLQSLTEISERISPLGRLYKLDFRLRPEGTNSPLVVRAQDYTEYFQHRARLWEKQAAVRFRCVAGDFDFGRRFLEESLLPLLDSVKIGPDEATEIWNMRRKMEKPATRLTRPLNIKVDPGGLVDVEFLAQIAGLRAMTGVEWRPPLSTLEGIRILQKNHLLVEEEQTFLRTHYLFLRNVESYLMLCLERSKAEIPASPPIWETLAFCLDIPSGSDLKSQLAANMARTRSIFSRVLERLSTNPPKTR